MLLLSTFCTMFVVAVERYNVDEVVVFVLAVEGALFSHAANHHELVITQVNPAERLVSLFRLQNLSSFWVARHSDTDELDLCLHAVSIISCSPFVTF